MQLERMLWCKSHCIAIEKRRDWYHSWYQSCLFRNCRKITDADCAGYFFESKLLRNGTKNVGVVGCGEAFCAIALAI